MVFIAESMPLTTLVMLPVTWRMVTAVWTRDYVRRTVLADFICGVLATIGAGLLYLLDVDTSTGKWIGYQIVAGAGWGMAFQIPMIAVQGSTTPKDLASSTGMLLCEYYLIPLTNQPWL